MSRILCISHSSELSGATLSLLRIASYLSQQGHDITVLFPSKVDTFPSAIDMTGVRTEVIDNPEISLAETPGLKTKIRLLRKRLDYVKKVRSFIRNGNFDLVYVNSAMGIYGGIAGKYARARIVWHIREDLGRTWGNRVRWSVIKHTAHSVIFVCRPVSEPFGKKPHNQEWFFIPNPVDVSKFHVSEPPELLRRELGIPLDAPVIVNVGFVSHRKGVDVLLESIALVKQEFPDVRVLVAGEHSHTSSTYWNKLHTIIENHDLANNVMFLGFRQDINRLLNASDMFVLSSRNEAMPVCVLEAMAAGKPIVATDVNAIHNVLEEGRLGIIVPPENPRALARGIIELLKDETQRHTMSALAREKALIQHQPEKVYADIERILVGHSPL